MANDALDDLITYTWRHNLDDLMARFPITHPARREYRRLRAIEQRCTHDVLPAMYFVSGWAVGAMFMFLLLTLGDFNYV